MCNESNHTCEEGQEIYLQYIYYYSVSDIKLTNIVNRATDFKSVLQNSFKFLTDHKKKKKKKKIQFRNIISFQ